MLSVIVLLISFGLYNTDVYRKYFDQITTNYRPGSSCSQVIAGSYNEELSAFVCMCSYM